MTLPRFVSRFTLLLAVALPIVLLSQACANDSASQPRDSATPGNSAPTTGEIRVFAAASLTDVFSAAARKFSDSNPGVRFAFNFGSSAALATQINEGAPADLFAAASPAQMAAIGRNALEVRIFATNSLAVAVPAGSKLSAYRDLANPGLTLVLAASDVPAGRYARESLAKASTAAGYGASFEQKVLANVKSGEVNVRAALAKVQLGEADAAIVYTTDIAAGSGVRAIPIPAEYNVLAEYPMSVLADAKNGAGARAFTAFLLSAEGRALLKASGFGPGR